MSKTISIIVPCYNEEKSLPYFYKEIRRTVDDLSATYDLYTHVLFIDDGSSDKTLELLRTYTQSNVYMHYISFSRNFGKEAAMYAGLQASTGDYVAVMDADMQDPPSLLPEMYKALQSGEYDSVATRRVTREGEPPIRSFFARCFYKLINKISDADIVAGARDFRLMRRTMVDAILSMREYNRFSKGIFGWVGFKTKWLPYANIERVAGETKWSFWKLFLYSLEGIVAFSTAPLAIASVLGFLLCLIALIYICFIVIKTIVLGEVTGGYPSMMCVILFIGGIQMFCTGILGQYLAKTYLETKKRPIYIVRETEKGVK